MREFYLTIDDALLKGLRPESRVPRNSPYLHECLGFRIGKNAIESMDALYDDVTWPTTIYYDWPFPQVIKQENWTILVVRDTVNAKDSVYSLNPDGSVSLIFGIDELTYGQGTLMELADFGRYAFLTNGVIMLYWDPTLGPAGAWDNTVVLANVPMMRTICNFKGRMIGGGVVSAWPSAANPQCDGNFIVWSKIGEVDFTPDRKNTAGFRKDPFGGEVFHVRRLGDNVIVYSSKGITKMFPVSSPAATFGFEELHSVGLLNRGAMHGDLKQHLFIDLEYNAWRVTREGLKRLGYQEYIEALDATHGAGIPRDTIINFNPYKEDFYISDGTSSLLLSPYGMTNYPYPVGTVWYDDEDGHGLSGLPETPEPLTHEFLIVSHIIDMGYRGQKTIFTVELGASVLVDPEVAIDWRMNPLLDFQRTDFVPVNDEGIASIIVAGTEFRVVVKTTMFMPGYASLDYITVRWKMTDLRGLRGIYAAPPRGQQ